MRTSLGALAGESGIIVDWLKWIVVMVLVAAGVVGNWYFGDSPFIYRALALVALALVAGFTALQTERGQRVWNLAREARTELRRVVWPTRGETTQTTAIVLILILLFALILWGLDSGLSFLVKQVIG
ncbi:MAG: preprotein translocase subunit SecE [Gammaproteobacteria bacterium]|nr:preprotein translocase subunit SecE [Gammaproteobacteria bacterium]